MEMTSACLLKATWTVEGDMVGVVSGLVSGGLWMNFSGLEASTFSGRGALGAVPGVGTGVWLLSDGSWGTLLFSPESEPVDPTRVTELRLLGEQGALRTVTSGIKHSWH